MKKEDLFFALAMFGVLLASRLIPHPANFTALMAVGLFAGSLWKRSSLRFMVPLAAMVVADLYLGIYPGILFNYLAVVAGVLVAPSLKASVWAILGRGVLASIVFFVISNWGVWYSAGLYSRTLGGLYNCYVAAIPFYHHTLISTFFYSLVFYGAYRLVFEPNGFEGFFRLNYGRR